MAILTFELLSRRFVYKRGSDYNQKKLLFQAVLTEEHELNVRDKGLLEKGDVTFVTEPDGSLIATLCYIKAWNDIDDDVTYQHSFSLGAVLTDEAFDRLMSVDPDVNRTFLTFDIGLSGNGLTYGYDPDGSEKIWDPERQNPLKAESFTIVILAKAKTEERVSELEIEEHPPLQPTFFTDPQLLTQLRAIWWAIVVFGSLILFKLSW